MSAHIQIFFLATHGKESVWTVFFYSQNNLGSKGYWDAKEFWSLFKYPLICCWVTQQKEYVYADIIVGF